MIITGTIKDWRCSVLGMGLYFFNISGSLWWVMLTFGWFAATQLKWTPDGTQAKSSYLHAIVWTISAVLTVMNIVLKVSKVHFFSMSWISESCFLSGFTVFPKSGFLFQD